MRLAPRKSLHGVKQTKMTRQGAHFVPSSHSYPDFSSISIDGALDRWLPGLLEAVDEILSPIEISEFASETELTAARIELLKDATKISIPPSAKAERGDITATTVSNERMTALDWNQDVRLIEFTLDKPSR